MAISQNGQRPVYAVTSNGGICNSFNNAYGALKQIRSFAVSNGRDGFVGLQLTNASTHVDSEGGNTNFIGYSACLQAPPKAENTAYLRDLSHSELAEQLKLPLGTVKSWIRRGLDQLRNCMAHFA